MRKRLGRVIRIFSAAAALVLPFSVGGPAAVPAAAPLAAGEVAPNATSLVDCNGLSPKYQTVKVSMKAFCADPFFRESDGVERAYDNGQYIGHDEPSVKFISSAAGSANHMTYLMQLATDPSAAPTASGSVTHYAELSLAPWFGLPMCDPKSYPQNPCTPDSDSNTGLGASTDAGSAFMELQFYAPGFGPFKDAGSCDPNFYCAALTIDSLACNLNFVVCNNNCFEPVNFAYLQTDGVPAGPPSPQLSTDATLAPNGHTLRMRGGDKLVVSLRDTSQGLMTSIADLTTGRVGFMVASAANGFMNTNPNTCAGHPFNFHPEYDTAAQQNQVPWAALEGGVLMQQELGHFESCNRVVHPIGLPFDTTTAQTCIGGVEGRGVVGEGPCNSKGCKGATTEGGGPCPDTASLCEFSDAICAPKGPRTVVISGVAETWSWPIAGCEQDFTQNGDLDFDGNSYVADWPDGSKNHPTTFNYAGPFDADGHSYPSVQFETDVAGSENDCNVATGVGCTALPHGAAFYPFWTIGRGPAFLGHGGACAWNFGNIIPGATVNTLGGVAEYGTPNTARYAGTVISPVVVNPQLSTRCHN